MSNNTLKRFQLPDLLLIRAKASPTGILRQIDQILAEAAAIDAILDRHFQVRQISAESFIARTKHIKSIRELNHLYWRDTASTIKSYALSSTWRILDLVDQACVLLAFNGVIGPAIIARSLLELMTVSIRTSDAIRQMIEESAKAWKDKVVISEELEVLLGKALYGNRTVPDSDPYKQTNILSHMKWLTKKEGFLEVGECYDRLCEIAHPNARGNSRFWSDGGIQQTDGSVLWRGGPRVLNSAVDAIHDDILFALAMSAANAPLAFNIMNEQISIIVKEFP